MLDEGFWKSLAVEAGSVFEAAYEKSDSQKVILPSLSKLNKPCMLDSILEVIYRPGILAAVFCYCSLEGCLDIFQQQLVMSTSFVAGHLLALV